MSARQCMTEAGPKQQYAPPSKPVVRFRWCACTPGSRRSRRKIKGTWGLEDWKRRRKRHAAPGLLPKGKVEFLSLHLLSPWSLLRLDSRSLVAADLRCVLAGICLAGLLDRAHKRLILYTELQNLKSTSSAEASLEEIQSTIGVVQRLKRSK